MFLMVLFGPKIISTRLGDKKAAEKRGTEDLTIGCSDFFEPHSFGT